MKTHLQRYVQSYTRPIVVTQISQFQTFCMSRDIRHVERVWHSNLSILVGIRCKFNPIPPGGGGGDGKCPRRFQLSRTSLIFKQYLPNVATFTNFYWGTRFWKNFASRVSHATIFLTPCLLKF